MMIKRDRYLERLIRYRDNGMPKVITGIRRCGKSYLLQRIFTDYLLSTGVPEDHIVILNLDSVENQAYCDPIALNDRVKELCSGEGRYYVIIDEIQNVRPIVNPIFTDGRHVYAKDKEDNAITFVNTVLGLSSYPNIDLYITGSNSRMLSTDVQTEFRGKAININVRPLSFEEYLDYVQIDRDRAFSEFLIYGGMPQAVTSDPEDKKTYLKDLYETTYLKDIVERYRFRKEEALNQLSVLLATCVGQLINSHMLASLFRERTGGRIDEDTVESYLNAFQDSFLLQEAPRYDVKGKRIIGSTRKFYYIDNGLRNARCGFIYDDIGQLLENVVYNELIFNGFTASVGSYDRFEKNSEGKTIRKSMEIDFLAERDSEQYYIQVCSDISDIKTRDRERKPFIYLNDNILKILVVDSPIGQYRDKDGFIVIGITDFLLRFLKK